MKYGLIGEKLGHSFSKDIHNKIADYTYELREIPKDELETFITGKDYCALNVTIPYKEKVIPMLDCVSEQALQIGAVNTIVNRGGVLCGYNTDFAGMEALLKAFNIDVIGKKVLILGSGGTSKTAHAVTKHLGAAEIIKVSRTQREGMVTYDNAYKNHADAGVIINTTPCGMFPNTHDCPIDITRFKNLSGVADAIYNPLRSSLITRALDMGIPAAGGLYMLVAQAVKACEKFLDKDVPDRVIDEVYTSLLLTKENIVLTGMPGAGKTTIGKLLSKKTGKSFVDSDEEIIRKTGRTPAEIIKNDGESAFRDIEEDVITDLSKNTGFIIATGGGAVLREANIFRLSQNGRIVFLDRSIEDIVPTPDRPLSTDRELLRKRYEERYPIYTKTADIAVKICNSPAENAGKIYTLFQNIISRKDDIN